MPLSQALLMMVALGASPAAPSPAGDYIRVEIRGTLRTGMMAIGGETTGTVVSARRATWELDLTSLPQGPPRAESLDGRRVLVKGSLEIRPGVERRGRACRRDTSETAILTWASCPRPTTFSPSVRGRTWLRQSSHRVGAGPTAGAGFAAFASSASTASPAKA